MFSSSRDDAFDDGDSCDVQFPGDPACDELRDIGDKILAPIVSKKLHLLKMCLCLCGRFCVHWLLGSL